MKAGQQRILEFDRATPGRLKVAQASDPLPTDPLHPAMPGGSKPPKNFYIVPNTGSGVGASERGLLFDDERNLPPPPPPGFVYQWEYAGYR